MYMTEEMLQYASVRVEDITRCGIKQSPNKQHCMIVHVGHPYNGQIHPQNQGGRIVVGRGEKRVVRIDRLKTSVNQDEWAGETLNHIAPTVKHNASWTWTFIRRVNFMVHSLTRPKQKFKTPIIHGVKLAVGKLELWIQVPQQGAVLFPLLFLMVNPLAALDLEVHSQPHSIPDFHLCQGTPWNLVELLKPRKCIYLNCQDKLTFRAPLEESYDPGLGVLGAMNMQEHAAIEWGGCKHI